MPVTAANFRARSLTARVARGGVSQNEPLYDYGWVAQ
jgi:hypothetical protein